MNKVKCIPSFTLLVSFLCLALVGAILLPMLTVRLQPLHYNPSLTVSYSLPNSSARVVKMEETSKLCHSWDTIGWQTSQSVTLVCRTKRNIKESSEII